MSRVASSIPGRIRVRDTALRQPDRLARLHAMLQAVDGVHDVESKPATGSVIVHYNAAHFAPEAMETLVEQHVDAELARPRSKFPPSTRMRINRAAKAGMLGSLAVSLALAATGNKRWHAASGLVFVACLGVHLTVHRRHLLR